MVDVDEDGGTFAVSKVKPQKKFNVVTKNINRQIKNVLIVETKVEFADYKIKYPKAIIFQFEDCYLVIEKAWVFSLAGFLVRLETSSDDNFGFMDELSFRYDPDGSK